MNPARSLARPLAVASAVLLTSAALPAAAGATESVPVDVALFDISPITTTWDDGTATLSGTVTNNTDDWSDCVVAVADPDSITAIEDNPDLLILTDPDNDAGVLASQNVWPAGGETASWSLSVPDLGEADWVDEDFEPAAAVWCWAGVAPGEDLFYFVYPHTEPDSDHDPDPDHEPDPTTIPDPGQPGTGSPSTGSLGS